MAPSESTSVPLIDLEIAEEELNAKLKSDLAGKQNGRRTRTAKDKAPLVPWRAGAIAAFVTKLHTLAAQMCRMRKWDDWASALDECAEPAGKAWEKLAKRHEWLRRAFDRMMSAGDMSDLLWAYLPLILVGANKAGLFGPVMNDLKSEFADALAEEMAKS